MVRFAAVERGTDQKGMMMDPYEVLGVSRNASDDEIKKSISDTESENTIQMPM